MKKLQIISYLTFAVALSGMVLWRVAVPFPDWLVRTLGILLLAALFTSVFSTVRISLQKK
jgi:hypothetical protein